jgi:biotin carboxylase
MKKIAVIGASYLQLPLVLKAKELGIETHCFAWSEGAVCATVADYFYPVSILDKEVILQECRKIEVNGIITIASDIGMPTISYIAEKLGLISNSYESALCSTNKGRMRMEFERYDVSSPKYLEVGRIDQFLYNDLTFPMIVKPVDRSGSRGISKVNSLYEVQSAIQYACEESLLGRCIVEEFIEGVEVSVECISWQGEHYILTVTDKVTTNAPFFVELAHHQPSLLSKEVLEKVKMETIKALDALKICFGASHSEFKITDKGDVYVIEVGARMGGDFIGSHLVPLSTGYDYLKGIIDIALNKFEIPVLDASLASSGIYFLCTETKSIMQYFEKVNDFDVFKQINNQELKRVSNSSDRSGFLIYKSEERVDLL